MAQATAVEDDEWLEEQYVDEGLSIREISAETGVPWNRVRVRLAEAGVEVEGNVSEAQRALRSAGAPALDDEEVLRQYYVVDDMTQEEIAGEFDTTQSTVSYYLRKHDFDTGHPDAPDELRDADLLHRLYEEEYWSVPDLASRFGTSTQTVKKYLKMADIEPRAGGRSAPERLKDRDWLADKLHGDGWSENRVADELDCDQRTVANWRRRLLV